jgi:hypothetical protein
MNRTLKLSIVLLLLAIPAQAQKSTAPTPHLNWQSWSN